MRPAPFCAVCQHAVPKSVSKAPTAPAGPVGWSEGDGCNYAAYHGCEEAEGLEGVKGQNSSNGKMDENNDGISSRTNKGRISLNAPDATALAADTGGGSGGGQSRVVSPDVDNGWEAWNGGGHGIPPRTSRSPARSPGLTPLRGRSRRGWWRRRRDSYPTDN